VITLPPAPLPDVIDVATAFPGARIQEIITENLDWILYVNTGWSVTVPAGWIVNTDPGRWEINPLPPDYKGLDGERLYPGTYLRAKMAGGIYVRYTG